ncbi:MAG: 30S ribosomal protein S6 [Deltaproteobacteria bacterium]|nr:30S ribosomal protein S6 [Deltaproteobacteria bacterium]
MARYETIFIVHPDQGGKVKEFIDRFKKVIEGLDGTVSQVDEWGLMDLAYRIHKQAKGYYILVQHQSSARVVEELERNMKISDGVLRYLTVRVDEERKPPAQPRPKEIPVESRRGPDEDLAKPEP